MKTVVNINVRAFPVKIRDERTGLILDDTVVLEKTRLQAAQLVGLDNKDLICRIYSQQGYKVLEVGQPVKKEIPLDLKQLYTRNTGPTEN